MKTLIKGGTIVNEGHTFSGTVVIDDDTIAEIIAAPDCDTSHDNTAIETTGQVIDATGCYVLPGIIDSHVHFREPGLTDKADIDTESSAAAAGGVTSYFDMPNTIPQTTTLEALKSKQQIAATKSHVNYAFFFGATNDNACLFSQLDEKTIPGIKLFMGSSTGNMLVDSRQSLDHIFAEASRLQLPIMAHCEDTEIINRNMASAMLIYGDDPAIIHHPEIRSAEACYNSTLLATNMAKRHGTQLHIAHLSTERELQRIDRAPFKERLCSPIHEDGCHITGEATVSHLYFSNRDYASLGSRIKCNPAIKTERDREALRQALNDGTIYTVSTDHAPHLLSQKEGGCAKAASGMPMVQFSLVTMLELVDANILTLERLVELMAHNPARLFGVCERGFLRSGYKADVVIVRPGRAWTVTPECILSRCQWSPMLGHTYLWQVERTICNGHTVYMHQAVDNHYIGRPIRFRHHSTPASGSVGLSS